MHFSADILGGYIDPRVLEFSTLGSLCVFVRFALNVRIRAECEDNYIYGTLALLCLSLILLITLIISLAVLCCALCCAISSHYLTLLSPLSSLPDIVT
jgi:hypothetical protein